MGTLISKPRNGENPPKKIRTRTYSGSSLTKKPSLFKSLSKRKDDTTRKAATLQPTRTGDNLRIPSDATTEPIVVASAHSVDKSSPVILSPPSHPEGVVDENLAKNSSELVEEVISKAADVISKEEKVNVAEESKEQIVEESLQVHCDSPAEAVKVNEHQERCEEQVEVEEAAEIARKVTDEVLDGSVEEVQKENEVGGCCITEEKPVEEVAEPLEVQETITKVDEGAEESTPVSVEPESAKEHDAPEHESMNEVVRDHQEAEIAEILVAEALNAGIEAQAGEIESESKVNIKEVPEENCEDVEPDEDRPQSSEQTSDYMEANQQSQSVSEVFADPNEVSDATKNIEAACLQPCESKDGDQELHPKTESDPVNHGITNGHDDVTNGDSKHVEANGHLENDHETDPIATLKVNENENLEFNDPTSIQE